MTVSRVVLSGIRIDWIVNGWIGFTEILREVALAGVAVRAVAASGVATSPSFEMVCSREDEVRTFVVEVFRGQLLHGWHGSLLCCTGRRELGWRWRHGVGLLGGLGARLHIAGADEGVVGGRVVGVEQGLDGIVQLVLGGEDELDGVSSSSLSAGIGRYVVGGDLGLVTGVGGCNGQTADAHDGQIDDIVSDEGELIEGATGALEDVVDGGHFVRLALIDELQAQIAGADGDGGRLALGDEADAQSAETRDIDAEAVVRGESLELQTVGLTVWAGLATILGKEVELTVGEDSIDIEEQDFYAASAVFRG